MDLGLREKVAIVTGSGSVLGKKMATTLAEEGASVVINDVNPKLVEETVAQLKAKGHRILGITTDVTDRKQVDAMVERVINELGRVDILVNNVGVPWGPRGPKSRPYFFEQDLEECEENIKYTIITTMNCSRAVLPYMIKQKYGKIVNLSSNSATRPTSKQVGYASGKGAVESFTVALAGEVGRYGINVNAVAPGTTWGPRDALLESRRETDPEEYRRRQEFRDTITSVTADGRLGTAEDQANAVAFLASDRASHITGQIIRVDGGFPQIMITYVA